MRIIFKLVVVVSALFLELVLLQIGSALIFGFGHGRIADTRYRQRERVSAWNESRQHPSPETKARFGEEMRLMHEHEDWKAYTALGLFVAVNGVWIYHYFRREHKPATLKSPQPTRRI